MSGEEQKFGGKIYPSREAAETDDNTGVALVLNAMITILSQQGNVAEIEYKPGGQGQKKRGWIRT